MSPSSDVKSQFVDLYLEESMGPDDFRYWKTSWEVFGWDSEGVGPPGPWLVSFGGFPLRFGYGNWSGGLSFAQEDRKHHNNIVFSL